MKFKFILPFVLFITLVGFLAVGLNRDPREVPSPLINKLAPSFNLPQLTDSQKKFSPGQMLGQVWALNVWASWCVACREEHPVLMQFGRSNLIPLIGLDYKDRREDAIAIINKDGNPYSVTALDSDGRIGIDYGVYGVPETYIIDQSGVIRYKHIGPINTNILEKIIYPLISELKNKSVSGK